MSTDDPETDLTRNTENAPHKLLTRLLLFLCATLSIMMTLSIVGLLILEAIKFFMLTAPPMGVVGETASIIDFLAEATWQIHSQESDVLALVSVMLMVTIGSVIIALPLGIATTTYLDEYASTQACSALKSALEILAGVPTAIYGSFALIYITSALEAVFLGIGTFNMLSASVVVGIMIIPMTASISEDTISAVPDELRWTGYGMDVAKFDVSTGIIVPTALSGILSSFAPTPSRAIGKMMAVTVAAGVQVKFPDPPDPAPYPEGALPTTAAMAQLLTGDTTGGGLTYRSLFIIGLVLFVITLVMNVISDYVSRRYRKAY